MRVHHVVDRVWVKKPEPNKVYGARIESIKLGNDAVTVGWVLFSRKTKHKRRATVRKEKPSA